MSESTDQLARDIAALQALVVAARGERDAVIAERDAAIAERDEALSQNHRLEHLLQQIAAPAIWPAFGEARCGPACSGV